MGISGQFVYGSQSKTLSQMSILMEILRHPLIQITKSKGEEGKVKGVEAPKSVGYPTFQIWLPEKIEDTQLNLNVR